MDLAELLDIRPGVIAVIGSGGKSTFLQKVGEHLARSGRVLLCTTTKIFPFDGVPLCQTAEEAASLLQEHRLICGGVPVPGVNKLGPMESSVADLSELFDYVLVEADGAAGKPMKAHASHEPVIPAEANRVITVVGASGFGMRICDAAHRAERFAELAGASASAYITPEMAAAVLNLEHLGDTVLLNQVEEVEQLAWAGRFAAAAEKPVFAGSLQKGAFFSCGF